MRAFLRLLGRLLAVLVAIALVAAAVVTVRGYGMYRAALEETPVERAVDEVRRSDGYVSASELPEAYLSAVVAVEDHRFYDHPGVDLISVCRAAWHDLTTLSLEQGGST
ncbi:transglycosylase domain-containing protein, partial [Thermophilibacter provencensis]